LMLPCTPLMMLEPRSISNSQCFTPPPFSCGSAACFPYHSHTTSQGTPADGGSWRAKADAGAKRDTRRLPCDVRCATCDV
jgi:hypothetical protein